MDGAVPVPALLEQAVPVGCWISEAELWTACGTDIDSDFQNSETELCIKPQNTRTVNLLICKLLMNAEAI